MNKNNPSPVANKIKQTKAKKAKALYPNIFIDCICNELFIFYSHENVISVYNSRGKEYGKSTVTYKENKDIISLYKKHHKAIVSLPDAVYDLPDVTYHGKELTIYGD